MFEPLKWLVYVVQEHLSHICWSPLQVWQLGDVKLCRERGLEVLLEHLDNIVSSTGSKRDL